MPLDCQFVPLLLDAASLAIPSQIKAFFRYSSVFAIMSCTPPNAQEKPRISQKVPKGGLGSKKRAASVPTMSISRLPWHPSKQWNRTIEEPGIFALGRRGLSKFPSGTNELRHNRGRRACNQAQQRSWRRRLRCSRRLPMAGENGAARLSDLKQLMTDTKSANTVHDTDIATTGATTAANGANGPDRAAADVASAVRVAAVASCEPRDDLQYV
jgi:hypothetical protein